MTLLRSELGTALRCRREAQRRTLRDVAGRAGVSLGYLSEVERGVKEASSEILAAICGALELRLPDLLLDVAGALYAAEAGQPALRPVGEPAAGTPGRAAPVARAA